MSTYNAKEFTNCSLLGYESWTISSKLLLPSSVDNPISILPVVAMSYMQNVSLLQAAIASVSLDGFENTGLKIGTKYRSW